MSVSSFMLVLKMSFSKTFKNPVLFFHKQRKFCFQFSQNCLLNFTIFTLKNNIETLITSTLKKKNKQKTILFKNMFF